MKKKVLVFASTFPRWKNDAIPPFVYELSKRLTKDFDISVLAPHFKNSKDFETMDKMKVYRFHYFPEKWEKLAGEGGILPTLKKNKWFYLQIPFFLISEFFALRKRVKEDKPDVIHAHWIIPQGFIAYLNYKISGTPYVVTTWGGDMFIFKKKGILSSILKWIYSKVFNNSIKSTTVNMIFKEEMESICTDKSKIIYIPNGTDTINFTPSKKDLALKKKYQINDLFILFVGRLAEKKGIIYLLEAMPEVIKQFPRVKLLIVGGGPLEEELKKFSKELNLDENVIFTGAISNSELPKYYATSDLFIAPSITTTEGDREGFPTVFVEAMASGTSILTTNIDGIKEMIENGKNGVVVNQKSSKDLSQAIIKMIKSKTNLKKMGDISRKIAINNYDWKVVSKKYMEVLR